MFLFDFYYNFLEDGDSLSNDHKDIFGSTHSILFMELEANLLAVSPGISESCKLDANHINLDANIGLDKGMLQLS